MEYRASFNANHVLCLSTMVSLLYLLAYLLLQAVWEIYRGYDISDIYMLFAVVAF